MFTRDGGGGAAASPWKRSSLTFRKWNKSRLKVHDVFGLFIFGSTLFTWPRDSYIYIYIGSGGTRTNRYCNRLGYFSRHSLSLLVWLVANRIVALPQSHWSSDGEWTLYASAVPILAVTDGRGGERTTGGDNISLATVQLFFFSPRPAGRQTLMNANAIFAVRRRLL